MLEEFESDPDAHSDQHVSGITLRGQLAELTNQNNELDAELRASQAELDNARVGRDALKCSLSKRKKLEGDDFADNSNAKKTKTFDDLPSKPIDTINLA
jgi:hypothetical protein